jgi:formylglycine-generating enzyme required for sulfatase activity
MKQLLFISSFLLFTIITIHAQDCKLNEEAQRYWVRGITAIKEVKNDADFLNAIEEFRKALQYAPDCPDIYYNIALCYDTLSQYSEAINYYKEYIKRILNNKVKRETQNHIYELEYKYDKLIKQLLEMVFVQGGTFTMGCTSEQGKDCEDDEKPAHQVTVSSFYIGKYEVTQRLWKVFMGTTVQQQRDKADTSWPIWGEGDDYPMYYVSWDEALDFINRLNAATGKKYRLLTEAEWEFAARGGNKSNGFKYSGSNTLDNVAWYDDNSGNNTHPVGSKSPNELGIYDMSGNVWEWCNDWYDANYYRNSIQINPQGPSSGSYRVLRGGSWRSFARNCRSANRDCLSPGFRYDYGFRLAASSL